MKYLLYICLGLFITGGTSLCFPQRSHEYTQVLLHFELLDGALQKIDYALNNDTLPVVDKKAVSACLVKARTNIQKLLRSEGYQQPAEANAEFFELLFNVIIAQWSADPKLIPSDKAFELASEYVDALLALFPYVKEYNKERIEQELARPESALVRLSCTCIGIGTALIVCILTTQRREIIVQQMHTLALLLKNIDQALATGQLEVTDNKTVSEYLARMQEIIQWISRADQNTPKLAQFNSSDTVMGPKIKLIIDTWKNRRSALKQAIEKEFTRQGSKMPRIPLTDSLIDALSLIVRSLEECETAVRILPRRTTPG